MSMVAIVPYFEMIADSLHLKLMKERFALHGKPIASGKRCFIEIGDPELVEQSHQMAIFQVDCRVDISVGKGTSDTDTRNKHFAQAEEYLTLAMAQRAQAAFKSISVESYSVDPVKENNEHIQLAHVNFKIKYAVGF